MTERGVYNNVQRGRQLLRFDGFRYGNITPTDIDGVIEYQNRIWLLYEAKLTGKDVPHGQRLALERWIADAGKAGKHSIAMIVEHDITDASEDVYLTRCRVRELYTTEDGRWRGPKRSMTAKELSDIYINYAVRKIGAENGQA